MVRIYRYGNFHVTKNIFDEIVTGILEILKEDAAAIILYGSVARGTKTQESDVDIAIIIRQKLSREKSADWKQMKSIFHQLRGFLKISGTSCNLYKVICLCQLNRVCFLEKKFKIHTADTAENTAPG